MSNYFDCKHCGHHIQAESGLITHIKRKHSQNYNDYRKLFGAQTQKQLNGDGRRTRWEGVETSWSVKKKAKKSHIEEMIDAGFSPIKCEICDFTSMVSITTHVTRKHRLTTQEYSSRFTGSKLYQAIPSVVKSTADKLKQRHAEDPEFHKRIVESLPLLPSKIEFWISRGFSEEEAERKLSQRQREMSLMGGEKKLQKLSQAFSGEKNPMSLVSISKRHGVSKEEASKLTPAYGRTDENHPMWGKKHTSVALEKIANSPHLKDPSWRSVQEIELANWCKKYFQCTISENQKIGCWNVDILFEKEKLIIEYFGCWWHADPRVYRDDWVHAFTRKTAKEIRSRDQLKLEQLTSLGYNVIIVWESDWKENPEREKERIINAYNRTP